MEVFSTQKQLEQEVKTLQGNIGESRPKVGDKLLTVTVFRQIQQNIIAVGLYGREFQSGAEGIRVVADHTQRSLLNRKLET